MPEETSHVSLTDVANLAEVRLSAVSNWRTRHSDFPRSRIVSGQESFDTQDVAQWLRGRKVPRNRLKPHEAPGISYGDRFLRNLNAPASSIITGANHEAQPQESAWPEQLWAAADSLRGAHDRPSSLKFLLGLVYVRTHRPDVWQSLIATTSWSEVRDMLSGVSLPMGARVQPVPVFPPVDRTVDPSLLKAVELVDKINLNDGGGPRSTAAQICDAILADLERGIGRSGGHFTPPDVAQCLVELLDPQPSDRVCDPFCGSGELLVAAAAHVSRLDGSLDRWQVCGQTPHEWSWLTSTINLTLHGVDADLSTPTNALQEDRFPDRRFSRILTNPPFGQRLDLEDRVWPFGEPPPYDANFAWLQHVVTKLTPDGRAAVLMPNGAAWEPSRRAMIRSRMVKAGVVESVIALPSRLFRYTGISVMVWVLRSIDATSASPEILFIDARDLGEMVDYTKRKLDAEDIGRVVNEYRRWRDWRAAGEFEGTEGFSRAVSYNEISHNDNDLTPSRYTEVPLTQPDVGRTTAELRTLWNEFDVLRGHADRAYASLYEQLTNLVAGQQPGSGGQTVPLGTVCDVLPGPGTVSRSGRQPHWTPLVLPRNIRNNRIGHGNLDVVPPYTAERLARYRLIDGDIVTARTGTLGRYGRVLDEQTGWLLGPGCMRLRPNNQANPNYLTYYLGCPTAHHWLTEHAAGSAIPHVKAATMREMPIWLPPPSVQRAIVEILEPLHTTVSIHNRISETIKNLYDQLIPILMGPTSIVPEAR